MTNICLNLKQEDGTVLKFRKTKIKARCVKNALKLNKEMDSLAKQGDVEGQLDLFLEFVVGFFNDPLLTEDTILDSLDADELLPALQKVLNDIMGGINGGGELQPQETPLKDITNSTGSLSNWDGV